VIEKLRPGAAEPGEIVHLDGRVLGTHEGVMHYTIGQRRGLGISGGDPLYVLKLNAGAKKVIVGPKEALGSSRIAVKDAEVKVRSTRPPKPARIVPLGEDRAEIHLLEPEDGVAPGQACVFYAPNHGTRVLGGGWIESAD